MCKKKRARRRRSRRERAERVFLDTIDRRRAYIEYTRRPTAPVTPHPATPHGIKRTPQTHDTPHTPARGRPERTDYAPSAEAPFPLIVTANFAQAGASGAPHWAWGRAGLNWSTLVMTFNFI